MPMSGSARAMKCKLLKEGKTLTQAMNYLFEHGYIKEIQKDKPADTHNIPAKTNDGSASLPLSEVAVLPPLLQEVLQIQSIWTKNNLTCSVNDALKLREISQQFSNTSDIPKFELPVAITCKTGYDDDQLKYKQLYDPKTFQRTDNSYGITKQECIINAICEPSYEIVAVEAAKRHGKSTAAFVGICQGIWENKFKKIGLWASGEDNACGILTDVFNDPISVEQTYPLAKGTGSAHQKVFFNNAIIRAFSNNASRTSGLDFELCWIDEAHEVVVEHKEVFDMILMTMRAKPSIKLLITMNKGTGTYAIFKDTLEKEFGKEVVFFTIEDEDIAHITTKADSKVRTLVKAVGGKNEVTRWLDNKAIAFGTFDPMMVLNAFKSYDAFIKFDKPPAAFTVESLDPSGTGHPMGLTIWSCDAEGEHFWMEFAQELQLGEELKDWASGAKLTPEQVDQILLTKAKEHKITHFISESNMNGKMAKILFTQHGYIAQNQNFGDDKKQQKGASRGGMCHVVRNIMDENALFFHDEDLKNEWSIYNPDEHESVAKFKGDNADSSIHAIFKLATLSHSRFLNTAPISMNFVNQHSFLDETEEY